ncbi:MAG: HK97 gp10 family phage protein [Candidatus Riesia sp.]|nr:HK97 gp10 family phage protein [Candidatus Riesia sp.]
MSNEFNIQVIDDGVQAALSKLARIAPDRAQAIVEASAHMIQDRAVKNIQGGVRTGKFYRATKDGKMHQASAPSEFPKSNTGNLVKNITVEKVPNQVAATVGSRDAAEYGYYLEFGTSKMQPRPWLGRSAEQEREAINKLIDNTVNRLLDEL